MGRTGALPYTDGGLGAPTPESTARDFKVSAAGCSQGRMQGLWAVHAMGEMERSLGSRIVQLDCVC